MASIPVFPPPIIVKPFGGEEISGKSLSGIKATFSSTWKFGVWVDGTDVFKWVQSTIFRASTFVSSPVSRFSKTLSPL